MRHLFLKTCINNAFLQENGTLTKRKARSPCLCRPAKVTRINEVLGVAGDTHLHVGCPSPREQGPKDKDCNGAQGPGEHSQKSGFWALTCFSFLGTERDWEQTGSGVCPWKMKVIKTAFTWHWGPHPVCPESACCEHVASMTSCWQEDGVTLNLQGSSVSLEFPQFQYPIPCIQFCFCSSSQKLYKSCYSHMLISCSDQRVWATRDTENFPQLLCFQKSNFKAKINRGIFIIYMADCNS